MRYEQVVRPGRHEDSWGAGCALRSYHKLCPIHPLARTHQLLSAVLLHTFVILTSVFFEAEVCALTATAISLMPKAAPTFSPSHPHPHTLTLTPSHPHTLTLTPSPSPSRSRALAGRSHCTRPARAISPTHVARSTARPLCTIAPALRLCRLAIAPSPTRSLVATCQSPRPARRPWRSLLCAPRPPRTSARTWRPPRPMSERPSLHPLPAALGQRDRHLRASSVATGRCTRIGVASLAGSAMGPQARRSSST